MPEDSPSSTSRPLPVDDERNNLCYLSGDTFWTIQDRSTGKILRMADGPHGVRYQPTDHSFLKAYPATCFPTACTLACSWDPQLVQRVGNALANECAANNIGVLLGPGLNLRRHPAGGRNFEYFSEDPYVSAALATAYVQGIQQDNTTVAACIKHYAVNNQETHRFVVNAVVDPRTLHELYLQSFDMTLRNSQPQMVMVAYNRLNGHYCCAHPALLAYLRRQTSRSSMVYVSDWGAVHDRVACIRAGLDLEMPGSAGVHDKLLRAAVLADEEDPTTRTAVQASGDRVRALIAAYGHNDEDAIVEAPTTAADEASPVLSPLLQDNHAIAHQAAVESIVLLRNENQRLPLSPQQLRIAIVGRFGYDHPRYQGMGSSKVNATRVTSVADALRGRLTRMSHVTITCCCPGYDPDDDSMEDTDEQLIAEAVEAAAAADVVLCCVGLPEIMESEGMDRAPTCRMPLQHEHLLLALPSEKTIAILSNGGVLCCSVDANGASCASLDYPDAVLGTCLAGQAAGAAVVDLLFGKETPCGKLTETWPYATEDLLANRYFPGDRNTVEYREGLLVGYRYVDTANVPVRYPFGYGLSYTTFVYRDVDVTVLRDDTYQKRVVVQVAIENQGKEYAGRETVQIYVAAPSNTSAVFRPVHELKAFAKTRLLQPGETETLRIELTEEAFHIYDIGRSQFIVEAIAFELQAASNSRDIRCRSTITFATGLKPTPLACQSYPPHQNTEDLVPGNDSFVERFGSSAALEAAIPPPGKLFHYNSLLKEVARDRWLGKILFRIVYGAAASEIQPGERAARDKRMLVATIDNLPLRSLVLFSEGRFPFLALDICISLMNYQFSTALGHTLSLLRSLVLEG